MKRPPLEARKNQKSLRNHPSIPRKMATLTKVNFGSFEISIAFSRQQQEEAR
jgi:hypothetical protein